MKLRGYIDESHGPEQDLFALSCVMARPSDWLEIVRKWKLHLDAKNKALKKAGRPEDNPLSRDRLAAGRKREFKGWDRDERDEFVRGLFSIIGSKGLHTTVFDISLEEVCAVFCSGLMTGSKLAIVYLRNFCCTSLVRISSISSVTVTQKSDCFTIRPLAMENTIPRSRALSKRS